MFDLRWSSSYELSGCSSVSNHDGRFQFSLRYIGTPTDNPTVADLVGSLSIDPELPSGVLLLWWASLPATED